MVKSGFVAVMGRPNVGKSTLVNTLLEQKVAPVSEKPQTTRRRQLAILTSERGQIIFQDTPGVHAPHHKLGRWMNEHALETLHDTDLVLFVLDGSEAITPDDQELVEALKAVDRDVIVAINKMDLPAALKNLVETYANVEALLPEAVILPVSARKPESLEELLATIFEKLPEHPPYYPDDQTTDWYEKEISAELIREAALTNLQHEVPHGVAVRMDEYTERGANGAYLAATIFVERESQKGIVIGEGGRMLKKIGAGARKEIEAMTGRRVFLELRVKVRKNWRNDEKALRSFGYDS